MYDNSLWKGFRTLHKLTDVRRCELYCWLDQAIGNRDVSVSIIIPKRSLTQELKLVPDEIKIGIAINEKIVGIAFPDLKGFTSGSIDFHKWCSDLFS
jgi:hypothetical protein